MPFTTERPPASLGQEPKPSRIPFTPDALFGEERQVILEIASDASDLHGRMRILENLREQYVRDAQAQGEALETTALINNAFFLTEALELERSKDIDEADSLETSRKHVLAQQFGVQYVQTVLQRYPKKEALPKLAAYWAAQEHHLKDTSVLKDGSFEEYRNGMLRQLAVEHVANVMPGWEVVPSTHPDVDAVMKIDATLRTPNKNMVFLQIKPADAYNEQVSQRGFTEILVIPYGDKEYESYLLKFQKGMQKFMKEASIPPGSAMGAYLQLSAKQEFINKVTGVPSPKLLKNLAGLLRHLDVSTGRKNIDAH